MQIAKVYSHLNGYEHIAVHKPLLWQEIIETIECIDAVVHETKVSKKALIQGELLCSPSDLNSAFTIAFNQRGWYDSRTNSVNVDDQLIRGTMRVSSPEPRQAVIDAGHVSISSYNQTDFVKDRLAVEVHLGKYAFVAYDLFVKHMAFYVEDVIDVGIEILPMKEMQAQMSSGISNYEGEIYNILRHGRSTPAVPLVVIGIAP